MLEKAAAITRRYDELDALMALPEVTGDPERIRAYAQEQAGIAEVAEAYREHQGLREELGATREMLASEPSPEMRALIADEVAALEACIERVETRLASLLLPRDPRDARNVIVEIRAGTGGDEATLFVTELFRMYTQYADKRRWSWEVLSSHDTGIGGYKEIIFAVKGRGAFSRLKYESGVHRVQRVPVTETSGRIHTSTTTVAMLPEAEDVEVEINERDLRLDVYRSGGKGGQSVNTTDSAVRITHIPTGIVVQCQDERSQLQNRARAMAILRARLYDREYQRRFEELDNSRRMQVGSAERSEKIRTYNYPQNRVTDHRIGLSVHRLEAVLAGELDPFIDALIAEDEAGMLRDEYIATPPAR